MAADEGAAQAVVQVAVAGAAGEEILEGAAQAVGLLRVGCLPVGLQLPVVPPEGVEHRVEQRARWSGRCGAGFL